MKRPSKINHNPTAAEYNALIDYIQSLEITVGVGLEKFESAAGTVLAMAGNTEVVVDVDYNTTTHVLKQTKQKISAIARSKKEDTTIDTAEPC